MHSAEIDAFNSVRGVPSCKINFSCIFTDHLYDLRVAGIKIFIINVLIMKIHARMNFSNPQYEKTIKNIRVNILNIN